MEKNNSFKITQAFVFIAACLLYERVFASNIYVDPTLSQDITNGKYSIQKRDNSGTDGNAYNKLQKALTAMKSGDAVFMRGGIYQEGSISIPVQTSGDSLHWSSLQSYPNEWAIIDGQNNLSNQKYWGLGYECMSTYECEHHHWRFERFEIKNCTSVDLLNGVGLYMSGGPFLFSHLYIHDNGKVTSGTNNPSGLRSYRMHDSKIEYCYFKNNYFTDDNCAHVAIFSDYHWQNPPDSVWDINHAIRKNEIRFNVFDGAYCGFKHKGKQLLVNKHSGTDMRFKEYGDKIHHNIFKNHILAIAANQDFVQIYNNIIDSGGVWSSSMASSYRDGMNITVYNNAVRKGFILLPLDYGNPPTLFHPYYFCVNNIVDSCKNDWDNADISVGLSRNAITQTITSTDFKVDRNFVYRPLDAEHYVIGSNTSNKCMGFLTTAKMNSCYGVTNFSNSLSGLYKGTTSPARFKTNGSFSPGSGFTISNGGMGGKHPYLDGITFPTYIGAVDPNDDGWVDGVWDLVHLADSIENTQPVVTNVGLWRGTVTYCDSTDTIFWKADDDKGVVACSLWVTVDNGSTWQPLPFNYTNVNKFTWHVPKTPNKKCQIWVRAYDAEGKYGDGKSPVFQISDKKKSILLKAIPLDETSAKVYWYASVPDSTSGTLVGIFYKTGGYVNNAGQSGSDSLICPVEVAQDTALNLSKRATYYFSAFFRDPGGIWESGGDSSQTSLAMPDLTPPVNNFSLRAAGLDSTKVIVTWHAVSQGSADADSIGICFRTDFFPSAMRENGATVATANDLKDSTDTIVGLKSNSVYYFSLFVRDTSGNWSAATETSKARAVLSSWGNKVTFPSVDTLHFYNDTLILWSTKDVPSLVDTIDRLVSLPVLTGFIQLSPCFYFRNGVLLQTGSVGIKVRFNNKTNNLPLKNARIYGFDLNTGKIVSENSTLQVVDTAYHSVTLITSDLRFPFMVLLDTLRPTIRWFNRSRQINPPKVGDLLQDTVLITDNIGNLTRSFYCGPGNASLLAYPDSMTSLMSGDTLFKTSIPQNIVQECSGYHAFVVVSDGINKEVLDVSRPVRLADSHCDGFNAPRMEWSPICLTAQPDNNAAQSLLASLFPQGGQWKYDKTVCRMIRWYPCEQNKNNPIKWVEFGDVDDSVFSLYPGIVTWIKPRNGVQIDFGPATMASLRDTAAIPLNQQEWTDFGLPFQFPVLVDSIIAATRNGNPEYPIDSLQLYRWKKTGKMYTTVPVYLSGIAGLNGNRDSLMGGPGNGYAAFNPLPLSLALHVPPQSPATASQLSVMGLGKKSSASGGYWSIRIDCSLSNGTVFSPLYCGYTTSISNKRPTYYHVPPSFSSVGIRVYDRLSGREFGHEVIHEFPSDGTFFDLLFCNSSDSAQEIYCNAATAIGLPNNLLYAIFDPYEKADIKAQTQAQVSVPAISKRHRFLAVGTKEYLERLERALLNQKTMLNTTYPNPFRKTIKVSFTLPFVDVREVKFQLFSCSGRIISSTTITTGLLPGLNSFFWHGPNGSPFALAAGTYIFRMSVAHSETNKTEIFKKRLTCLP